MTGSRLNIFTQHSRNWRSNRYVYPVVSRRSGGLSIGVNLNPDKACNFDCVYCSVDRTVPSPIRDVDLDLAGDELQRMIELAAGGEIWSHPPFDTTPQQLRRLNDVAFSGDGEPTSFSGFLDACQIAAGLLQKARLPHVKLIVITNATLFHQPRVQEALRFLDSHNGEIWAKLDAGTDAYYRMIERTNIPLQRVLDNILTAGRERPIVIQSLFMNVQCQPPSDHEIDQYVQRLVELCEGGCQIKLVQVYTVAREPAESYVTPLAKNLVDSITHRVRRMVGVPAEAFYAPS